MRKLSLIGIVLILSIIVSAKINTVSSTPGISVTITAIDPIITVLGDKATFTVSAESITTEAEYVRLTVSGDPTITFSWDWPAQFELAAGETKSFTLEVSATLSSIAGTTPSFIVLSEAWPTWLTYDEAVALGLIQTSSYTDNVILPPEFVIPEYPFGTIAAMGAFLGATGLYVVKKRRLVG